MYAEAGRVLTLPKHPIFESIFHVRNGGHLHIPCSAPSTALAFLIFHSPYYSQTCICLWSRNSCWLFLFLRLAFHHQGKV